MPSLTAMLGLAALAWPLVMFLVVYDLRWIALALRARQTPPWGAFMRLAAALFCHGGAILLALHAHDWTPRQLTFWLHMTLDPGLTFYAFGLYELFGRVQDKARPGAG